MLIEIEMAFAIYRRGEKIRKVVGNPRSPSNQKGLVVWAPTKTGVKQWVRKYGSKSQKETFLK